jgi:hypothetical protein
MPIRHLEANQVSSSAPTFLVEPEVSRAVSSKWSPGWVDAANADALHAGFALAIEGYRKGR